MSLLSMLDDFSTSMRGTRRHRLPLLSSFIDSIEDEKGQRICHVVRRLPYVLLEIEHSSDDGPEQRSKRRKLAKSRTSEEPKSKALVTTEDDRFQVQVDTSNFHPDNIVVKVVGDRVEVAAKHEAENKDVSEFHEILRSFDIPGGVDPDSVTSRFNAEGQLTIEAAMKAIKESANERTSVELETETGKEAEQPSKNQSSSTND